MMPLASKDGLYRNRKLSPLGGIANFLSLMEVIRVTTTLLTVSITRGVLVQETSSRVLPTAPTRVP